MVLRWQIVFSLLILNVILGLVFTFIFKIYPEDLGFGDIIHTITFLVSFIVLIYSVLVKRTFGKIISNSFTFIIIGILFLSGIHFVEILFEGPLYLFELTENEHHIIEHMLYTTGMISFGYAFYVLVKSVKN